MQISISFRILAAGAAVVLGIVHPTNAGEIVPPVDFTRDIRPILARNCFTCHGSDEGTREAGLRLDRRESALAELDSGSKAIVPEHLEKSELYARLRADIFSRMPPADSGRSLTTKQIELIENWIKQGAPYERHWSFEPIGHPEVPPVEAVAWPRNEIDDFVLNRLEREGLEPSPPADRVTLIRRLSLDLVGLPPTPAEVDMFLNDQEPGAYGRLVDRLLESPYFGERWGRHWLDLARYADSNGYLGDGFRPTAYRYRDWVIDAFNRDLPFDEFTISQIAGDLVEKPTLEQRIATGFHRNAMKNTEAGSDQELNRVTRTVDRVSVIGSVWLGLTVGCAECHSHKFDPISHQEFYELYAFFNNIEDSDIPAPLPNEIAAYEADMRRWSAKMDMLKQQVGSLMSGTIPRGELHEVLDLLTEPAAKRDQEEQDRVNALLRDFDEKHRHVLEQYEKVAVGKPTYPKTKAPTISEVKVNQRRTTHVHLRGEYRRRGEEVQPGTPAFLHPLHPRGNRPDRLDFARWLVDPENPLTPRVTVNRIWTHLLGRGLVNTVNNFGISGEPPSHPELLDWLARTLIDRQLSRKEIIRLIVMSATYRQASTGRPDLVKRDPLNILLARQSRFRLEAEIIRDMALSVSGLLNPKIGGPSIRPPMNTHVAAVSRNKKWDVSEGAKKYRRGIYIEFRRVTPYPMLMLFDAPDSTVSCARRERSNSPLQALTLLNGPVFFECATHFGSCLARVESDRPEEWITLAFRKCLARKPTPAELQRLVLLYREQRELLEDASPDEIQNLIGEERTNLDPREQAARVIVARSLMNLDEFITRE